MKLSDHAKEEKLNLCQIWFQNRRQNDRRKSRPLLPHEMVPHFRNSVPQVLLGSAIPGNIVPTESHRALWAAGEIAGSAGTDEQERSSSRASSIHELLNPPSSTESNTTASSELLLAEKDSLQANRSSNSALDPALSDTKALIEGADDAAISPQHMKSSPGGVKRSHDHMIEKERDGNDGTSDHLPSIPPHGSHVRLSMSLDGAVKVKTNDEETPSPPKHREPAPTPALKLPGGLQRSKSAIVLGVPLSPRTSKAKAVSGQFGRSRDARTWEFYCDGDAREALSAHAENERAGSAVGAINLIRSRSQKSRFHIMTERPGTSNVTHTHVSHPRVKTKLSRAKSSTHLQDMDRSFVKPSIKKGKSSHVIWHSGDSDKENWAPGTRSSHYATRRQHTSTNGQSHLGHDDYRPSQEASAGDPSTNMSKGDVMRKRVAVDKDYNGRSEQRKTLIEEGGKGEDLDCIQGLLSLSQGAWR